MSKIAALKQKRAAKVDSLAALLRGEGDETRSLNADEQTALDQGESEVRSLDQQIRVAELVAESERRSAAGETLTGDRSRMDLSTYSVARACSLFTQQRSLDGIEGEYHQEATRYRSYRGIAMPTHIFLGERRDGQIAGTGAGGGFLTAPGQLQALADRPRPTLKVQSLGATVINAAPGDLDFPNTEASTTAYWVGENDDTTRSEMTFGVSSMSAKTVSAEARASRKMLIQSAESIEAILRRDIGLVLATEMDRASINGTGAGMPLGLLMAGIEKISTAANFSDTTADMIANLEMDDWSGTGAFLSSPKVANVVRKIKETDSDRVIPLAEIFHNVRAEFTTQVPDNIGAGSNKSALIYGIWSELILAYWSSVDLLVNPYHPDVASNGGVLLHAFLDCDALPRRPGAFNYAEI